MKYVLTAAVVVSLLIGVSAQPQGLIEARDQMNAAAAKGDKATYAKFMSDDATWVDRAGRLTNKVARLGEFTTASGAQATSAVPEVRAYGNAAVMFGSRRNPDGIDVKYVQAWVKDGNQWQLVAHGAVPSKADQPGSPATKASSALPANVGPQAERDAVQKNIDLIGDANRKADGKMFAAGVTDQFVALTTSGLVNKQERMQAISSRTPQTTPMTKPTASSTRIHGNLAVTTSLLPANPQGNSGQQTGAWQTVVTVKEGGQWKRAAIVTTPITGAARPSTQ
jgi:ketosteroid isomerase-like protein